MIKIFKLILVSSLISWTQYSNASEPLTCENRFGTWSIEKMGNISDFSLSTDSSDYTRINFDLTNSEGKKEHYQVHGHITSSCHVNSDGTVTPEYQGMVIFGGGMPQILVAVRKATIIDQSHMQIVFDVSSQYNYVCSSPSPNSECGYVSGEALKIND